MCSDKEFYKAQETKRILKEQTQEVEKILSANQDNQNSLSEQIQQTQTLLTEQAQQTRKTLAELVANQPELTLDFTELKHFISEENEHEKYQLKEEIPYKGGKPMYLIDMEDIDLVKEIKPDIVVLSESNQSEEDKECVFLSYVAHRLNLYRYVKSFVHM